MNLGAVMDEIGTALEAIDGLRVFPYNADKVNPPAAVLAWPDPITFDETMGRGSDRETMHLFVMVGRFDARTTRDRMAAYLDGSGASSVKAKVEGGTYAACDSVRVVQATVDSYTSGGVDLLGADFELDIVGRGA